MWSRETPTAGQMPLWWRGWTNFSYGLASFTQSEALVGLADVGTAGKVLGHGLGHVSRVAHLAFWKRVRLVAAWPSMKCAASVWAANMTRAIVL
jgi:hypothetical protein